MHLTSIVAVLAAGLSVAAGLETDPATSTTSSTTTVYQTITVTRCNPDVTNCPLSSSTLAPVLHHAVNSTSSMTTSTISFPAHNSTKTAGPTGTGHFSNSTVPTRSSGSAANTGSSSPTSAIPTAGAPGRFVQTGLMLGLVAAGVAILA